MTIYIIAAILCIVFIIWGLNQCTRQEPECRGCKHDAISGCDCPVLCECGEMWEE